MTKFKLATDKLIFVGGVLTELKAGEHETKDKQEIEALKGAVGVEEVKSRAPSKDKD